MAQNGPKCHTVIFLRLSSVPLNVLQAKSLDLSCDAAPGLPLRHGRKSTISYLSGADFEVEAAVVWGLILAVILGLGAFNWFLVGNGSGTPVP